MKEQGTNPLRQALSGSGAPGPHPDADVLAAFGESALQSREQAAVLEHLAGCAECREVLSMATAAAESEPASARVVEMPVRWPAVRRLAPWLAAAAVLLLVSGIVVREEIKQNTTGPIAEQTAPPALPAPAPAARTANAAKQAQPAASTNELKTSKKPPVLPKVENPREMAEAAPPKPMEPGTFAPAENTIRSAQAPQAHAGPVLSQNTAVAADRAVPAPAAPLGANSASPMQMETIPVPAPRPAAHKATGFTSAGAATAYAPVPEAELARPRWRINAQGEPERAFSAGTWQRVPLIHTGRMRAIAVLGTDVWTGGDNTELYRSRDNGATWVPVALPEKGGPAQVIAHIRIESALRITVEAVDGTTWTSEDGGTTWQ